MVSLRKSGFDTGGMPQKILALTEYDTSLIRKVHSGNNKMLIEKGAANMVSEYFMKYLDARARSNKEAFHHVYEWDMTGNPNARLFKKKITSTPAGAVISFSFIKSKEPNSNGYVFANKAAVMESGQTVVIRPKNSKFLVYSIDGNTIVTSKPSVVENPGGTKVQGSFAKEWGDFSSYQGKTVLREFKFFERVNTNIRAKRKAIVPRIDRGMISGMISEATKDAEMIAIKAGITNG